MKAEDEQAFREFVTSQMASLRKLAYMTCGDWHAAEDAVANALVKLYPRWRKLERPDLYVKTMVYRAAIDETRRPWRRERSAGDAMPDVTVRDTAATTDERMRLRAALETVPARQRAAVVLRHYLDLSLEDTAAVLGCTVGTAKSQVSRGLAKLRESLGGEHLNLTGMPTGEWTNAVA
ncbi:SigE family RNA polymerase sigma factor [Micromonospora tulbaghiae]|uniref:RNA polymerase sigma-70 factor, sigma-E family n=1 Tax=Micromonospora tulbaghiae TaxID=479978 RepID=A0AAW4JLG0_9ACTN|nr:MULTISPECIES: SigE family RNA polymerase sigma factor [Micromonospora]KAB1908247.1 SigE family RNA polymerase sigma factor [Micromonospora sp. AMSO1212t]MBO4139767.1 SigE family RNA polymerase sigma factor [Micromonospora tulbaghiae]MDX5461548.1 SigE family RNA polymerase sigma factor [Micromonospora tulbaghiae]SCF01818.1 RNA polymerase sigma-70 factor, sigma-E family [Micromonospora tulbaghiae]